MANKIVIDPDRLQAFCQRHGIKRLALFGSCLSGSQRADSDVDFLVEFQPDESPGFIALAGMEEELSQWVEGRKVDLRTPRDLSHYFRDQVMAIAEVLYAA